jgi:leucyl aminopeptidase (aminopeptidase T)
MAAALAVAAVFCVPVALAQPADQAAIAKRLVAAAGLHEGDLVMVWGGVGNFGLLEEIVLETRALGAHPLLTLWSQRLAHDTYTRVPERFDAQAPVMNMKLAEMLTALISVDIDMDPDWIADIPEARREARNAAGRPVNQRMLSRKVRIVNLGSGLFPSAQNAGLYGIPKADLERMFWAAVAVDPAAMQAKGAALKAVIDSGRELRITHPNGSDLRFRVEGRKAQVSDGVISPAEAAAGGGENFVALPAGELLLAPVPGTAEGVFVAARDTWGSQDILDWKMTFAGGRLAAMTGRGAGFESMRARYESAAAGKEAFAGIDIGLNPAVKLPPGVRTHNTMPEGMVSIFTGDNTWLGGESTATFSLAAFLPGATVTVDGNPIVEKGVLK